MAAEGGVHESFSRGEDGRYQIRIESYDPARNTMKAIWLVSRSERVLTELLDKCEVPDGGNSDDDLRGNLLSVQRELQELRDAMDRSDGTRTPVLDASMITTNMRQSGDPDSWSEASRPVQSSLGEFVNEREVENLTRPVSAAPAMDFGLAKRKRVFLSQIPLYSRPSIRTDFSVAFIDPFPELRLRPSKIPKPAKVPKKKKNKTTTKPKTNKTSSTSKKKLNTGPSTKSSVPSKVVSQTTKAQHSKRPTSKSQPTSKPISTKRGTFSTRVSSSKKVASFETIDEKKSSRSTKTNPGNKPEKKQRSLNTTGSIPRSSSRLTAVSNITPKTSTGRRSSVPFVSSSYMQMYMDSNPVGSKTQRAHPRTTKTRDGVVKNPKLKKQARSRSSEGKRSKMEDAQPEVLPFESPPPVSKLHSCPVEALDSEFRQSVFERSVSPFIRSVSIIDNTSEGRQTRESNNAVPRIRIDDSEEVEYQVKAYFLDDCAADNDILKTQGSAIIPSSPVEIDDECTQEDEIRTRDVSAHLQETAEDEKEEEEDAIFAHSLLEKGPSIEEESSEDFDLTFSSPFKQESNLHKPPEEVSKLGEEVLISPKSLEQDDDSILFDKDASLVSVPYEDALFEGNQSTTQNDFGFLAEFEDEVSGLLDSLMSQEFDQTFNLAPPIVMEDSLLSSSESFNLLTKEEDLSEQPPIMNVQSSDSTVIHEPTNQSETELEQEDNNDEQETQEQEIPIAEVEAHQDEGKTKKEEISQQEGSELAINSDHPSVEDETSASGVEALSIAKEAGKEDHSCSKETVVTAESRVRRKSTGASLGKPKGRTTTATLERRHSQSGLQRVVEKTRRPSSKNSSQLEVEEHWSEESSLESLVFEDPSSRDPCGLLETSVILSLSSSELTIPDPCESYHDSNYGDSTPSLQQSRDGMDSKEAWEEFKSLPYFLDSCLSNLNSFANPVALSLSESTNTSQRIQKGHLSFDYLAQKRQGIDKSKPDQHQGHHSTPNLSWRDHSNDALSSDEEKELDEIELCISPKRHPYYLRDGQLRSHGTQLHLCFKKECSLESGLGCQSHNCRWEVDSNASSVVALPETEEDLVEDTQKQSVSLNSQEQNSSMKAEFANNEKLQQRSCLSEIPQHLHIENSPPESLRDVPLPLNSNEVVVETQKAGRKRKSSARCGLLRFCTCSRNLEQMDNQF